MSENGARGRYSAKRRRPAASSSAILQLGDLPVGDRAGGFGGEAGQFCGVVVQNLPDGRGAGLTGTVADPNHRGADQAGGVAAAAKGALNPNYGVSRTLFAPIWRVHNPTGPCTNRRLCRMPGYAASRSKKGAGRVGRCHSTMKRSRRLAYPSGQRPLLPGRRICAKPSPPDRPDLAVEILKTPWRFNSRGWATCYLLLHVIGPLTTGCPAHSVGI